jgi:hypothetical protein
MAKFLVLNMAEPSAMAMMATMTPEQSAAGLVLWQNWAASCGDALVDLGAPVGPGSHVEGGTASGSSSKVCGYSVLEAPSLDEAQALVADHPHLRSPAGPAIEVLPYLSLPGM